MHALEDLSVSGCDQLARDFTRQQQRVLCVSWTPRAAVNLPTTCALDLSVNGCIYLVSRLPAQQQRAMRA
jgi:hypothetical protein